MDRLLRDIQAGLLPGREPAPPLSVSAELSEPVVAAEPVAAPPAPSIPDPSIPDASIPDPEHQALSELSGRLLASMRELLAGYERVLLPAASPRPPARRAARQRPDSPDVTLSAGPFASLEALRDFEQAVSRLPGVRDVAVRGYEGVDRAIIEVRLDQSNP
jgi:hypothetical protein